MRNVDWEDDRVKLMERDFTLSSRDKQQKKKKIEHAGESVCVREIERQTEIVCV